MALQNDALLRPYVMAYVRQEWGYKNELEAVQSDGTFLGNFYYEQRHLYGGVDGGLTYTQGNTTFAAAMYYEGSGSEHTLGGRLGVSQKLDGLAASGEKQVVQLVRLLRRCECGRDLGRIHVSARWLNVST